MARYEFGQGAGDTAVSADAQGLLYLAANTSVKMWDAATAGNDVTAQCVQMDGSTSMGSTITIGASGLLPRFYGPDDLNTLWVDGQAGAARVRIVGVWLPTSVNLATETLAGVSRKATQAETSAGASDTGFVTPLKLASQTLLARAKNVALSLLGSSETAATWTVTDDASNQANWPDRFVFKFGSVLTGHFNRYGELRAHAAKNNTVAFGVRNTNASATANLIEASTSTTTPLFAVQADGSVVAPNIGKTVVVLDADDPVPANTPDRSLIVRLTSSSGGGGDPTTLLREHPHEGTAGQPATAAGEGYSSASGTPPLYVAGGVVGATALRFPSAVGGHFSDTFPAQSGDIYIRGYLRMIQGTNVAAIVVAVGVGSFRVRSGDLGCWDGGAASFGGTLGVRPANNVWIRWELQVATTFLELKTWNDPASTGAATQTIRNTLVSPAARPTTINVGQTIDSGAGFDLDAVAISTSPIGPVV